MRELDMTMAEFARCTPTAKDKIIVVFEDAPSEKVSVVSKSGLVYAGECTTPNYNEKSTLTQRTITGTPVGREYFTFMGFKQTDGTLSRHVIPILEGDKIELYKGSYKQARELGSVFKLKDGHGGIFDTLTVASLIRDGKHIPFGPFVTARPIPVRKSMFGSPKEKWEEGKAVIVSVGQDPSMMASGLKEGGVVLFEHYETHPYELTSGDDNEQAPLWQIPIYRLMGFV